MKFEKKIPGILIILFLFFLIISCKPTIISGDLPYQKDQTRIKLLDSTRFEYEYYYYDGYSSNSLIRNYCKGVYFNFDNNVKILVSDTFDNLSVSAYIYQNYVETQDNYCRFIVNTNIFFDKYFYESVLFIDDVQIPYNGCDIDTLINNITPKKIMVKISLKDEWYNKMPKASFKDIITNEIIITDYNKFNYFNIKIPISSNNYNYKKIIPIKIKDMGDYYLILESNKKALKI